MEAWPELLSWLARGVTGHAGSELPPRLCSAFVGLVGLDGAAITLGYSPSERTTVCATDTLAEQIEDAQDLLREGPSLEAHRTQRTLGPVCLNEQRQLWPLLSQHFATPVGGLSVCAFPMAPQGEVLGVLLGYQRESRPLQIVASKARLLADAIGIAVVGSLQPENDVAQGHWLVRDQISQATGMVMAQLGLPSPDALAVLRAHAFAQAVPLSVVGQAVVDRALDFSPDTGGQGS